MSLFNGMRPTMVSLITSNLGIQRNDFSATDNSIFSTLEVISTGGVRPN